MFGGSLWCLLFCLLFNFVSLFFSFSRGGSGYKSLFNVSCWQNGAAAWVPFVLPQIDLISVQSMSNQCLINVRSMSDQCLINVRPMSYQFLINIRSMSDQCQTNSWYILSFWSISLEFLICFSDQWQKLPISNLTFLSLSTNRFLKFMSSDQYGTNIDWIL